MPLMAADQANAFLKRFAPAGLIAVLFTMLPVASEAMSEHFDDEGVGFSRDSQLQLETLSFQFFLNDTVSSKGFFSIHNNGVTDSGTDESDLY